jgi:protein tyrosine phosphatase (PTP) superfamily phosphohydrolase (DUF442 family)
MALPAPAGRGSQRVPRRLGPLVLRGCAAGLLLALVLEAFHVFFGANAHVVLPGQVYRSAQLSGPQLESMIQKLGVRTVVNLRGCCDPLAWYVDECRATHHLGVAQEDIRFSAGHLPSTLEVRRFLEVLDHSEYPLLFHCRRGADRTGMASAMVRLLQTSDTVDQARRQLGLRYGHVAIGRPAYLDRFLDLYEEFLRDHGLAHSPANFRYWIEHGYCPAECRCVLEAVNWPSCWKTGEPTALHLRATNTSVRPWRLRPGANAGVHAEFTVLDDQGTIVACGRAGLFDAVVAPEESIDLILPIPAIRQAGHYLLQVDMVNEQHCEFHQAGSEILEQTIEVQ